VDPTGELIVQRPQALHVTVDRCDGPNALAAAEKRELLAVRLPHQAA
jgi:hypothetical protein